MQQGYFDTAWSDVSGSPGWVGKLLLLTLVSLIPVFGWIVVLGYLFGWAREIAWGVRAPLPARIFGNVDGLLYSRGASVLVILFLFSLAPFLLSCLYEGVSDVGGSVAERFLNLVPVAHVATPMITLAASLIAVMFALVGSMRASIYGRLASGLQINRIWTMIRYDMNGLLRIAGMAALLSLAAVGVVLVLMIVIEGLGLLVAWIVSGGGAHVWPRGFGMALFAAFCVIASLCLCSALVSAMMVFATTIVVRALGHWTAQFDVAHWRGQDDPLPFEEAQSSRI
ncbi:DUF4013 domain-containing protein [Adlercreutzia sp. ZJ138]|uniref:DUF4013 domain-containing protein n=1 Tax=Adlercreutzia sp. ZJ138 TaxID=2709405 RepID=UPI0013EA4508|nr:DUF4013 domain-containing protein [Adlercreutzia sp. ZJ138]